MKNWKEIYEEYKKAVQDSRDIGKIQRLEDAAKKLSEQRMHIWDGCFDRLSCGCVIWKDYNARFVYKGIERWGCSFLINLDTLRLLAKGDLAKCTDTLSRKLVHEMGAWIMNRREDFTLIDVRRVLNDIEDSVRMMDRDFCEDVKDRLERDNALAHGISEISDMLEGIEYGPMRKWSEMLSAWADEELFKPGAYLPHWGTIEKVNEKSVTLKNGTRKSFETINLDSAFRGTHPEIERKH